MAPEPLRNACNAEEGVRIRLELTLAEGQQLQRWLADIRQADTIRDDDSRLYRSVLEKLDRAASQATRSIQCPVCQRWFPESKVGRSAQYCSAACKQKAYRQRHNARKRQTRASRQGH